ncbi:HlyD family secretion protein [Aquabacter sp. CN5-332]|uniref:HlyD family secretion protein n=1 Tax=Aquabacter sp. CN5-332 TaxID=3156608 RepID=UPI0032B5026D
MAESISQNRPEDPAPSAPDAETRITRLETARKPAPEPEAPPASSSPAAAPKKASPRGRVRRLLFLALPVALVVGGYFYVTGGQVMTTDNAYVHADTVGVSTDVPGTVVEIAVHDNELVKKGQLLFRLKDDNYRIALAGAEAQLGTVRNQILTLQASYQQALVQIKQAEADLPFYEATFNRQKNLLATAAASQATYDSAKHDLEAAQQKVAVAKAQAQAMLAQLGGDANQKLEDNPFYLQAASAVDRAKRDLADTVVKAPFDGIVTKVDSLQVGAYLPVSQPGFSLISSERMWIEASPKETELTYVRPGQKVAVFIDTYPDDEWNGTVESISPASDASFSLLPAQNTSGNWVKVVQRIPMRVTIDPAPGKPPLRAGMSAELAIDTGHPRGLPTFLAHMFGIGGGNG